jgi:hypothetical protein
MIGTPFKTDDEKLQRKVNKMNQKPWEQEARDEQGRRRFHGAFTGGFSAGYFNTVGSKEGWAPSKFVSNRGSKGDAPKQQSVTDYMDEEDIKEQVGVHNITSKDEYKNIDLNKRDTNILGTSGFANLPQEIFPTVNSVLANKLMENAGFNTNKDSVKEFTRDSNKYYRGPLEFKDNYYGVGYVPGYDELMKKKAEITVDKNRIKMGTLDEDAEAGFFNPNDLTEYNYFIEGEDNKHKLQNKVGLEPTKFLLDNHKLHMSDLLNYTMPKLPQDFDPFNRVLENKEKLTEVVKSSNVNTKMNPEKRNNLLITGNYFENKFTKGSEINSNSSNSNTTATSVNKPPSSTDQINNVFNFKIEIPFKNDLAKVSRFAKFIAEKEGLIVSESYYSSGGLLSSADIKEEMGLFQQLYEEEQKLKRDELAYKKLESGGFNTVGETTVKKVIREKGKWKPDKLLCKRFKLKDPYEGVAAGNINAVQKQIMKEEGINLNTVGANANIHAVNNEKNTEIIVNNNIDLNLFEAIFGD